MHTIAVVALDGVSPFDLGIACEGFARCRDGHGAPLYEVRVCGWHRRVRTESYGIVAPHGLEGMEDADTVIVPGVADIAAPSPGAVLEGLRRAAARGARMASICTGAFVLAAAGLLDGRRATTHWAASEELARRHPRIDVDRDVLFVDEESVVTSAGASAGLDMCLHLVARDHGHEVAARCARLAVSPLHREGGQSQFVEQQMPPSGVSLAPLVDWVLDNIGSRIDVATMAAQAGLGSRTFARRFEEQMGSPPARWLSGARIRRAQALLEGSALSLDEIARACGFASLVTFRARFGSVVGRSPAAYRRAFSSASVRG